MFSQFVPPSLVFPISWNSVLIIWKPREISYNEVYFLHSFLGSIHVKCVLTSERIGRFSWNKSILICVVKLLTSWKTIYYRPVPLGWEYFWGDREKSKDEGKRRTPYNAHTNYTWSDSSSVYWLDTDTCLSLVELDNSVVFIFRRKSVCCHLWSSCETWSVNGRGTTFRMRHTIFGRKALAGKS